DALADRFGITAAVDVVSPRYSPFQFRAGLEVDYDGLVALRAGLDDDTPTFGLGAGYRSVRLDYAFRDEELGANHRFSVAVAFGASTSERRQTRQERQDAEMHARLRERIREFENGQRQHLVARADSLFAAGNYAAADEQYGAVLAWDPSDTRAVGLQSECRFHLEVAQARQGEAAGDYPTALYHFRRAEQFRDGDAGVTDGILLCEQRIQEGHDRAAMVQTLLSRSIDLYASGQLTEALPGFREVLRTDPGNALAREYERKTTVSIQSVVEQNITRARTRAERGDFPGAMESIEQARALAPQDERVAAELAAIQKRQQSQSTKDAHAVTATPPEPAYDATVDEAVLLSRYREGIRLFEQGNFEAATRELLVVWTAAPGFHDVADTLARAYLFLGMQAYSKGSYDEAIASWEHVLTIDPGNAKARRYLKSSREEASRLGAGRP
ncbi:MAG: hypothetical protein OEY69_07820, partial [Candidatus Krumholzibacteria bacterium]|nr:hypothetical protein [Candidatus Krumholzibacteria bacterium]